MDTDPCELEVLKKKEKIHVQKTKTTRQKKKLIPVLSFNEFFSQNGLNIRLPSLSS